MDFSDHTHGVPVHSAHQHGRKDCRNSCADNQAEEDQGIDDVKTLQESFSRLDDTLLNGSPIDLGHVGAQHRDDRQTCCADGKAFRDRFDRVASAIQLIRNFQCILSQVRHLDQTARIVDDGTVGVIRDDHAHDGQHANCGHRDAVHGIAATQRIT